MEDPRQPGDALLGEAPCAEPFGGACQLAGAALAACLPGIGLAPGLPPLPRRGRGGWPETRSSRTRGRSQRPINCTQGGASGCEATAADAPHPAWRVGKRGACCMIMPTTTSWSLNWSGVRGASKREACNTNRTSLKTRTEGQVHKCCRVVGPWRPQAGHKDQHADEGDPLMRNCHQAAKIACWCAVPR